VGPQPDLVDQRDNGADPRRLPVILPPAAWDAWLDPTNDDTEALAKLLVPAPAELLVARPVTTAVNSTRNDGPELIAEATGDRLVG
jgi:putative SOS response-associated peptidase YedK